MKSAMGNDTVSGEVSPSPRRAWIEIHIICVLRHIRRASPSPRRAWIEISNQSQYKLRAESPSPRRAWIEIDILCAREL